MSRWLAILLGATIAGAAGAIVGARPSVPGTPAQAVAGPAAVVIPDVTPIDDPFPILRLRATEMQLPLLLKQLEGGPLVHLTRSEFEARVRGAGRAIVEARMVPRITETRFHAALVGGDLSGTGELDVVNTSLEPHFLPLDPLRLAIGPATWSDGREAVVGIPPGGTLASVWMDRPGQQTLRFGWSVAGVTEPGERRFELRLPAAASAVLDLELPGGQVPTVPADVLLTGPFPLAGNPSRANWRFRFGGRSRLDFAIRPTTNQGGTAAARLEARYDLAPGQLTGTFEYDLRPARGTVGEWTFTIDHGLHVTDVVVNNRAGWIVDPPAVAGGPRRLRVNLNQPGAGGKVLVSAVAPFPDSSRPLDVPLPVIRPTGAVLEEERLELRLAPGFKPERWNTGDYRLIDSQILTDQTRTITLVGTLLPAGADQVFRHPPTLSASTADVEFTTTEQLAWQLDGDHLSARLRVGLTIRRGSLFRLPLHAPPGYVLARVTSQQDDLIAQAGPTMGGVVLEFTRPLSAGQTAELVFEFRGPVARASRLPFPAFVPIGAAERTGILGIRPGPLWTIETQAGAGCMPVGWLDLTTPQPPAGAAAAFRFQGIDPEGWVTLIPAPARFTMTMEPRINRSHVNTILTLRLSQGALPSLLVLESEGSFQGRTWRVSGGGNAIAAAVPTDVGELVRQLGLLTPAWSARLTGSLPARVGPRGGRLWLIRFARPVTGELTLETSATSPIASRNHVEPSSSIHLKVFGAAETRVVTDPNARRSESPPSPPAWEFSAVYLVTAIRSPTDAVMVFGGMVNSAAGNTLPIRLPVGAEVRAAAVGGRWVEPGERAVSSDGVLQLPIPVSTPIRFEVRYRLPISSGTFVARVRSPDPVLPGARSEIQRWWAFGAAVLPGWPVRAWERGTIADLPGLLGDVPVSGAGIIVSRSPATEVRVGTDRTASAIGIGIAAVLFALGWAGGRRQHPLCGLLVVAGLLAVGAANLLGPPWWERAAMVPMVVGLVTAAGMVVARGRRTGLALAAGIAVVLTLARSDSPAQPSLPAAVILLPRDVEGREVVVAPKAVLDRLALIARPAVPGVILTAADYAITTDNLSAHVTARYVAHAVGDVDRVASLPLTDARLERVTINGNPAFPTNPRPGTYAVALPGKGRHEIEVRFAVLVTGGGGPERELRFGVPECPATRMTTELPPSARQIQVVGRIGKQVVLDGDRRRTDVDVGSVKAIQLRWRDGAAGTASIKIREGCTWDVSESGAELTACYIAHVEQGTVSTLQFDVPAELEPLGVALRPLDASGAALRDWSLGSEQGGFRPLRLDLQGPTGGRLLIVLTCSPRKALTRQPLLRFPRPVVPNGSADPYPAYGLRVKGVVIEALGRPGLLDFTPDALIQYFSGIPELRLDPNVPMRAFRPTPGAIPELRPTLLPALDPPGTTLDTLWHVGPHRADATGTLHWSGKEPRPVIEFLIPAVRVLEVHGTDVANWAQTGGRVHVWLRKPAKEGGLEWIGTTVPIPSGQPSQSPFDVPSPRMIDARLVSEMVHIQPVEGWSAHVDRDRGWTTLADQNLAFQTTNPLAIPVRILLTPAPRIARPDAFGWLSPSPHPQVPVGQPVPLNTPAAPARPTAPVLEEPQTTSSWVWPVSAAVGWGTTIMVLSMLLIRFPRTTWPEQFGLVGGLFGMAVVGHWWVGLLAWALARAAWLLGLTLHSRPVSSQVNTPADRGSHGPGGL